MTPERLGIGVWIALVALQPLWYLALAPPRAGAWLALAITLPPLLLPLFARRSGVRRMLLWLGVAALFYFAHGVVVAWVDPHARVPAMIEAGLCIAVIGALAGIVRRDRMARSQRSPAGGSS